MTQFPTLFRKLSIFTPLVVLCLHFGHAQAQDSTKYLTIPAFIGDSIIADLERLDQYKIVVHEYAIMTQQLTSIILLKDSIHGIDSMKIKTMRNIQRFTENEKTLIKSEVGIYKRKARKNGIWRDVFIGTTLLFVWLTVKP